jgi:hypothetical protein
MKRKVQKVQDLPVVLTFIPYIMGVTKLELHKDNWSEASMKFLKYVESNVAGANIKLNTSFIFDLTCIQVITNEFIAALFNIFSVHYSVEYIQRMVKFTNVPIRAEKAQFYIDDKGNPVLGKVTFFE